ncbi:EamA family transporter RarD [Solimonas terrae]|uniref:EamA family transporter RarD n=1 Tax=Solimonas terrae TaxID=1396819 RepID=A0A6M2BRJ9_9GAMM|nr:EamA family transporter RarD [Solimonas terrae]NGY05118.1 EamA family transporter RarD [Solimonas terrae]
MSEDETTYRRGFMAAFAAFLTWGLLPLYISLLKPAGSIEIMAHRVVWACLFVFGYLAWRGELGKITAALRDRTVAIRLAASASLISINWLVYVWAVGNGHVLESSLGYFINPLVSVLLGVFVLSERLNRAQWLAVSIAALGVAWLSWQVGRPPWIALTLAVSFGTYGLVRKMVVVDAVAGLGVETLLITPLMFAYLAWAAHAGTLQFAAHGPLLAVLLIAGGVITAVPLVLFAYGVRRVPLSTIGLMQYVAPTMQFLGGIFVFHEAFTHVQAIGFGLIWLALVVYAGDGLWRARRPRVQLATA